MVFLKNKIVFGTIFLALIIVFISTLPAFIIDDAAVASTGAQQQIGTVDVSNQNEQQMITTLEQAIEEWLAAPVKVKHAEEEVIVTADDFIFDIPSTISTYEASQKKTFWQKIKPVHVKVEVTATEALVQKIAAHTSWDPEPTLAAILTQAQVLDEVVIEPVLVPSAKQEAVTVASSTLVAPSSVEELVAIAEQLNDTTIAPQHVQSVGAMLEAFTVNQETLDFIATAVYHAVLQTDYTIIERHPQLAKPSYIDSGYEASIDKAGFKNLLFSNDGAVTSTLKASVNGNKLTLAIKAPVQEAQVTLTTVRDAAIKPKTLYRYSRSLPAGTEKVIDQGTNGTRIEVVRKIVKDDKAYDEVVARDYYPPTNRIVMTSTKPKEVPSETPKATGQTSQPNQPTKDNPPLKSDGTPDASQDDGSGDQQVTKDGYYDKGGNFHSTK